MAKYIILNGKVYNIKWPKKLYYFDKTLIAKKYSSGIWSETELKMSLNHSKCRMILFYLLSFISATLKAPSTSSTPATIIMLLCTEPTSDNIAPPATAAII